MQAQTVTQEDDQEDRVRFQVFVGQEAARRLRAAAGARNESVGDLITALAVDYLPEIPTIKLTQS